MGFKHVMVVCLVDGNGVNGNANDLAVPDEVLNCLGGKSGKVHVIRVRLRIALLPSVVLFLSIVLVPESCVSPSVVTVIDLHSH